MNKDSRILILGANGMVGRALCKKLKEEAFLNILTPSRSELDLCDERATEAYFFSHKPDYVFMAAAKVGGILSNKLQPYDYLYENSLMALNSIEMARRSAVKKFLYIGSSCIYPKLAPQPIHESSLLTGALEPTNEGYAIAKITGVKLCEYLNVKMGKAFISAMPCNLYGPHDRFDSIHSHVIPALMLRLHKAKIEGLLTFSAWGTGTPLREFLHVDDLADALCVLMQQYNGPETINVGSGQELSIAELTQSIAEVVGYKGAISFDSSKPDGTPRKIVDSSKMRKLGWTPHLDLHEGLRATYQWALDNHKFEKQKDAA